MTDDTRPWYEVAFGPRYDEVYSHRDDASADREIAWLADVLEATAQDSLLDVGCGNGRHLAAWSRRGLSAVGIDLSPNLVERARERNLPNVCVLRGDMRELGFGPHFDLVTNLFTSFGYFEPEGDRAVIRGIVAALRPGGRFAMDYLNAPAVRASLVPHSRRVVAGAVIEETRRIDDDTSRVEKDVVHRSETGEETRYRESVRLYERVELETLLAEEGLLVRSVAGELDGSPYDEMSSRIILIAERKGES